MWDVLPVGLASRGAAQLISDVRPALVYYIRPNSRSYRGLCSGLSQFGDARSLESLSRRRVGAVRM